MTEERRLRAIENNALIEIFSHTDYYFLNTSKATQLNLLTPNVNYSGRTAPLTSKVAFYIFIQQI